MDVEQIKTAFRQIAAADEYKLWPVFEHLTVGQGNGPLIDYQAGGGRAVIRGNHAVAALYERSQCPGKVYFLLSALMSVINRAEADYKDDHERQFHARLVNHLLQLQT